MKLEDKLRSEITAKKLQRPPNTLQGVTKERIAEVLQALDRASRDQIDAVFALLDDLNPSWFYEAAEKGLKVCHGASTAHIACHVGVLQRNSGKLDREGRDYWLKPLWEIGVLEKLYFDSQTAEFLPGHPVPKSPNSAYRIAPAFLQILKSAPKAATPPPKRRLPRPKPHQKRQKLPVDTSAPFCHYPAMLDETRKPILPHPRNAEYLWAREKQILISLDGRSVKKRLAGSQLAAAAILLLTTVACAQVALVTMDTSPAGQRQVIDGFGTWLSGSEAG